MPMDRIQTGAKALDVMTDGGLSTGTITQIFGEKALGKSILSLQAAYSTVAAGSSAIILDTEQSYFSYLVDYRKPGFEKRFGDKIQVKELKLERSTRTSKKKDQPVSRSELVTAVSSTLDRLGVTYNDNHMSAIADVLSPDFTVNLDGTDEPSIFIVQMPDIIDLLALHGHDVQKIVSEGGRVELRLKSSPVYQSALHQIVEATKAKLLVYDSLSAPFKSAFLGTQDLPARSAGMAILLAHAQRLCVEYGLAVVVTSHASINPMAAWDRGKPYGGITLGHEAKFSFELTKNTSKRNKEASSVNPEMTIKADKDGRAFWVHRHPGLEDFSRYGHAYIDDEGFH
ncbi:MAG TPA: ATPase domain-containing protein [Nitrososphaerales archaeon]|nr:ATPase domain-containing protein [Nitrososphaerales archaeon]